MFDFRRSLRLPLAAAAILVLSLTTACGDVTGPRADLMNGPAAPSRAVQPASPSPSRSPAPTQKSDSTGGKTTNSGYNVWA